MIEFQKYLEISGIDRSTLFRWLADPDKNVHQVKFSGKAYIVDEQETYINVDDKKKRKQIIASIKEAWNQLILQAYNAIGSDNERAARTKTVETIEKEVKFWQLRGVDIVGYNEKSIYRKIKKGKVNREQRADKLTYRRIYANRELILHSQTAQSKLLAAAWHLFGKPSACLNYKLMYAKIKDYAEQNEMFYELAAIPESTMINFLKQEFTALALDKAHQLLNHYNLHKKTKARNKGAFTSDIQFMDYIIGDDHKMDIDKVFVYDELSGKMKLEKVQGWFWIEGKTQKILSYVLKTGDLNADDLKISLMEALAKYGRPKKAIMIDNGVGRASAFQDFCIKAGLQIEFSTPYEPTEKANVERIFRYMKDEFDVFENNYVGSDHAKEGRHKTSVLSPEACQITFKEYSQKLETYLTGFYETRERRRVIDNKVFKISIKDLYEHFAAHHVKDEVEARILAYAYQFEKVLRYNNGLTFTMKNRVYNYMPDPNLTSVFNGKRYIICYNPNDMNKVFMYAIDKIIDKTTGEVYERNEYITALESYENFTSNERRAMITAKNKKVDKHLRQIAELKTDVVIASTVDVNGEVIEERKAIKKRIFNEIKNSVPVEKIKAITVEASQVKQADEMNVPEDQEATIVTDADFADLTL